MFDLVTDKYFSEYEKQVSDDILAKLPKGDLTQFDVDKFNFYSSVASVYSSKIEGEDIEMGDYLKHKDGSAKFKPQYTKRVDDLFKAYQFAQKKPLTAENFLKAHAILSKNYLVASQRGQIRQVIVQVKDEQNRILYVGASPQTVKREFDKLFSDIDALKGGLSTQQSFYFAAFIHLLLLNIHPFTDGNGRSSRLLEKWFLSEHIGKKAWFIPSEKYYYHNLNAYYSNLQRLGWEYEGLNYDNCLPFLLMLPSALDMPQ
jgi:Fic family protein